MVRANVRIPAKEPVRLRMSYEEYLAWSDEDIRAEWVNGEVIIHMPVKPIHQIVLGFLSQLLRLNNTPNLQSLKQPHQYRLSLRQACLI
jgi:Uma2 family endonuclease